MRDDAERINRLAVDEQVQADQVCLAEIGELVVHGGVALGVGLEHIEEVKELIQLVQLEEKLCQDPNLIEE